MSTKVANNQKWQVGNVSITQLIELEETWPLHDFLQGIPGASVDAVRSLPWVSEGWLGPADDYTWRVQSFLLESEGRRIIVDTGIGNNKNRALDTYRLDTDFLERLERAGWSADSVDAVICTHLHVDHVGWNTRLEGDKWVPTFPKAKYYFVREEYEHWLSFSEDPHAEDVYADESVRDEVDGKAVFADSVAPIAASDQIELVSPNAVIAAGVRLAPSFGHTPGHVCVVIESEGEEAVITGDAMHTPFQIAYPEWSILLDTDMVESAIARRRIVEQWGERGTFVIGTHFGGPTGGWVTKYGDRWGIRTEK